MQIVFFLSLPHKLIIAGSSMKRPVVLILAVLVAGSMMLSSSCSSKNELEQFGNLNVQALDSLGNPVVGTLILLSKKLQDLNGNSAIRTGWTDASGNAKFTELNPGFYWYGAQHYKDGGAVQVYSGNDYYVILVLNSPGNRKK